MARNIGKLKISFGFIAFYVQLAGILHTIQYGAPTFGLLYAISYIDQMELVCRAVFCYFLILGVKKNNVDYVFPVVIDSIIRLVVSIIFSLWDAHTRHWEVSHFSIKYPNWVTTLIFTLLMEAAVLLTAGNYYLRLRRGNLISEEQM